MYTMDHPDKSLKLNFMENSIGLKRVKQWGKPGMKDSHFQRLFEMGLSIIYFKGSQVRISKL